MYRNVATTGDLGSFMSGQGVYEESSTPNEKIGKVLRMGDRTFCYAKAGATLAAGKAVQSPAPVANYANRAVATTAIGSRTLAVTLGASAAADAFREGVVTIIAGTGVGQTFRIKGHAASDGSNVVTLQLYDELTVATSVSDSKATILPNPYNGVIVVPNGGLTAPARGVPLIAVTSGYYFWLQVAGPGPCLTQGTVVIGQPVGLGGTVDGACGPLAADTTDVWGTVMSVSASGSYSIINWKLG